MMLTVAAPDLRATLEAAAAEARARADGDAALLLWTVPLPSPPDPVAFFAAAAAVGPAALWQQPERGTALVGAGEAVAIRGDGQDRFGQAGAAWAALAGRAVAAAADGAEPAGPLALGGFAFDPLRPRGAEWGAFPDGVLAVPSVLLRLDGGRAGLTVAAAVARDDDPVAVAAGVERAVERWRRAPGLVPVCVEPPPPVVRREAPPPAEWKRAVARAVADIRAGRLDKVVLARSERVVVDGAIDVPATLLRMREANRGASLFAFARGGAAFLGASPETLVRLRGDRFETTPLAGSIARGATPAEDARLAAALLRSAKDRHEHDVVVGAILQALAPVADAAEPDPAAPLVVANRTVQHLATPIRGRARPGVGVLDLLQRLHPTPAVGGYPTAAALAAIREREGFDRGWYAGPVGWVGADGGEFAIGIRSALVAGNAATLYAGCGLVGDSDPDQEYEETRLKLRAIGAALGAA